MDTNDGMNSCTRGCWLVALLGGILVALLLMVIGDWSFISSILIGVIVFAIAGVLLNWFLCSSQPAVGAATTEPKATRDAPSPATKADDPMPANDAPASATNAAAPAAATASAATARTAEVKPSTPLAGEAELAERKGEWKYEPETVKPKAKAKAKAKPKAKPAAPKKADAAPAPAASAAAAGEGKKPETLSAARDGGPDNLKEIKGVGPKLEALLQSMGFYHFDQVAAWGADEVAWVDQNLQGFKGRVSRDDWVAQAKILAAGGETEFSKKVDKGGVY